MTWSSPDGHDSGAVLADAVSADALPDEVPQEDEQEWWAELLGDHLGFREVETYVAFNRPPEVSRTS